LAPHPAKEKAPATNEDEEDLDEAEDHFSDENWTGWVGQLGPTLA
jgi:hypothetical protein